MRPRFVATLPILIIALIANDLAAQTQPTKTKAELEAELSKSLSGAVLEGSFNSTAPGSDPTRLFNDRYTLGDVRKMSGDIWMIQAKIQFRGQETMFPLALPIEWAGDTPVIVVDNFSIPGMGTFSARVMFFDGHYNGYWKHGAQGGNMFGVIKHPTTVPTTAPSAPRATP